MADKIVQLTDKNSNNLYPIAGAVHENAVSTGGLSNGAVTTPKIANTSVTSQKIDWTTIDTGWVSCTLMNGWTEQAENPVKCRRFGKIVMIRGNIVPPSAKPTSTSQIVLKVPSGYEPAQYSRAVGAGQYTSYYRMEINATGNLVIGHKIRGDTSAGNANVTENNNWDLNWYGVDMTYFVD